jgi:hypothetical protein
VVEVRTAVVLRCGSTNEFACQGGFESVVLSFTCWSSTSHEGEGEVLSTVESCSTGF